MTQADRERARDALAAAERILVVTGAGLSAESGIRTFRGRDGWWRDRDPITLATPQAFAADPRTVWEWYDHRRVAAAAAEPNPGHRALAALERAKPGAAFITQNVDDLLERAGCRTALHLHGSLWHVRCVAEGDVREERRVPLEPLPPVCDCGALLRPDVVWFGEFLPPERVAAVEQAVNRDNDVLLVVGTEAAIGYVHHWCLRARAHGATVIEVNPSETGLSAAADLRLRGPSGELLPDLVDGLGGP